MALFLATFLAFRPSDGFTSTTIDVLIVYDTTAQNWVSTNGGIEAFSVDAVSRMNQALINSGISDLDFRLVHSLQVDYTTVAPEESLSIDLGRIQSGTEGLAPALEKRDEYGADLVALFVDTGSAYGSVGIGYLLTRITGSPSYAFTVSSIRSVEISHTLTHEVGHNLGAHHAKNQTQSPGPNGDLGDYAAGWYFRGTADDRDYHTIMAYNSNDGKFYHSAQLFSTPSQTVAGTAAGDLADGDNTRVIRETMATVSNYRESQTPPNPSDEVFSDSFEAN